MGHQADSGVSGTLDELLLGLTDRALAGRLRKVYSAAAIAISRLAEVDLLKYEIGAEEGAPDLSLWEEMAPVIRDTVVEVNALLLTIREQFPAHDPGSLGDTLQQALEEAGPAGLGSADARRSGDADAALQEASKTLAEAITRLGERMRSPSVVSDRWNLLGDLQEFRARARAQIGAMVHASASAFAEVHRKDVVPFYKDEMRQTVTFRATVSDLIRVVIARAQRVREAEPEDVQWNAQQLVKELDMFGKTPAYLLLRAPDKRTLIEFRSELGKLALLPSLPKKDLVARVEPFAALVKGLTHVNRREILLQHDREVAASCGVKLEHAQQLLATDAAGARALLGEAITEAQALYGRSSELDGFVRKARKRPTAELTEGETRDTAEHLIQLVAGLALYTQSA